MNTPGLRTYALYRLPLVLCLLLLGVAARTALRPAVELSQSALERPDAWGWRVRAAEFLSRVHGLWVTPDDLQFLPLDEPPAWFESLDYLPVVFLAVPEAPAPEVPVDSTLPDVFYAEIAVTPEGVPVDSRRFTNVTRTPLAREVLLGRHETVVAVAAQIFGRIQTVQLLDFAGDRSEPLLGADIPDVVGSAMVTLQNWSTTGRWRGVNWTELLLTAPADRLESDVSGDRLELRLRLRDDLVGRATLVLSSGAVQVGAELLQRQPPRRTIIRSPLTWAVNWVRDLSPHGADRIAVLEELVFGAADRARRLRYDWFGGSAAEAIEAGAFPPSNRGRLVIGEPSASQPAGGWPPLPLVQTQTFSEPLDREGEWVVAEPRWLRTLEDAPPAFVQTYLRTDTERPWTYVSVIAMDLRQLELHYQQGTDHPRPTTGRRGTGEIPRDLGTMERLVAAFNGGFKTTHGHFGSVVEHVVYLEPTPRTATIAWTEHSDAVLYGTWGPTHALPADIVAMRQNLRPLVEDGQASSGAWRGFAGRDLNPVTERSAVCFEGEQTLFYFWSGEARYQSLARAMEAVGCDYGIHLDMNPGHTGYELYRVDDFAAGDWQVARPTEDMGFSENRYLETDTKDFFYLLLRRTFERELPALDGEAWSRTGMPTTSEGFLPVVATLRTDAEAVRLVALDRRRTASSFALGPAEPPPAVGTGYPPREPLEAVAPVVRIGFDAADAETPRGLTLANQSYFAARGNGLWLVIESDHLDVVEAVDPPSATRIELLTFESLEDYGGVCSAVAELAEPSALIFTWGNVRDTRRRLEELGVTQAGVLGCGRHAASAQVLEPTEAGWRATDVFTGDVQLLAELTGERSQLLFEALPRGPRARRMFMNDAGRIVFERPSDEGEPSPRAGDDL